MNRLFNLMLDMILGSIIRLTTLFVFLYYLNKYPEDEDLILEKMNQIDKEFK